MQGLECLSPCHAPFSKHDPSSHPFPFPPKPSLGMANQPYMATYLACHVVGCSLAGRLAGNRHHHDGVQPGTTA